jgi:protein-arginine deiminase
MTGTRYVRSLVVLGVLTAGVVGLTPTASADTPQAELRSGSQGTTFLANIDDDAGVCQVRAKKIVEEAVPREKADDEQFYKRKAELQELQKTDPVRAEKEYAELQRAYRLQQYQAERDMAACNDAADEVVNGAQDEADLARIHTTPWIVAPASASGRITVPANAQYMHVFIKRATWELVRPDTMLSADEIRHGVELGVEGRDIVRDTAVWDGRVTLNYTVAVAGISVTAGIQLKEAPVTTQNNTQKVQNVLLADRRDTSPDFDKAMVEAVKGNPLQRVNTNDDAWMQDMYEPAYTTMPGPDGKQHGMRVLIGSVNNSRRLAARTAFTEFAGHDVAAVHIEHAFTAGEDESLDSMGNLETIPPTPGNPAGRIIVGGNPTKQRSTAQPRKC